MCALTGCASISSPLLFHRLAVNEALRHPYFAPIHRADAYAASRAPQPLDLDALEAVPNTHAALLAALRTEIRSFRGAGAQ